MNLNSFFRSKLPFLSANICEDIIAAGKDRQMNTSDFRFIINLINMNPPIANIDPDSLVHVFLTDRETLYTEARMEKIRAIRDRKHSTSLQRMV